MSGCHAGCRSFRSSSSVDGVRSSRVPPRSSSRNVTTPTHSTAHPSWAQPPHSGAFPGPRYFAYGGDGDNGPSFNTETRSNGAGTDLIAEPRVRVRRCRRSRGGRSIDTPRTQAAPASHAACVREVPIDRSARPMGRAGIGLSMTRLGTPLRAFYEAAVDSKLRFGFPFFSSSSRRMKRVVMSASGLWMST